MLDVLDSPRRQRQVGLFAWTMAWVALVAGQLHALARFGTSDGREDLELPLTRAWAEPAADALAPLLEWGDPDLVYLTYGKVWLPVFAAFTICAFVVRRRREPRGFERWAWRVALTGYVGATLAVLLSYWTQWSADYNVLFDIGWMVTVPSLLLTFVGSTMLGAAFLLQRERPVLPAALLVLAVPLALAILQITALGNAVLPIAFAFGILGRGLAQAHPSGAAEHPRVQPA